MALFVGAVNPPNVDALDWLLAEIWPLVRRARPDARLRVVGRVAERAGVPWPEGAEAVGFVDGPRAANTPAPRWCWRRSASAAASRSSWSRAWPRACPASRPRPGAEGLAPLPPGVLRIAGTAEGFAAAVADALGDPDPAAARAAARAAAAAHYARDAVARRLAADLDRVRTGQPAG